MAEKITNILDHYPDYEATIGIEVHVQLKTASKMFCSCPTSFGQKPNTNICPVCAGHPGTLPVPNRKAVDYAIMAGLATNCEISSESDFARKHYMYPDLPKNYQITQGDIALCMRGHVPTTTIDGKEKMVGLTRIHMEEDAGKAMHMSHGKSFVDLNRAGTPLIEIVSDPDISNAHEARNYLVNLRNIMLYLGVSDVNMEEGSFRADINISVKKKGAKKLGTRCEIKNVNSFKFIVQAINYEIERQIEVLEDGGAVVQATRLWNEKDQKTVFMRGKSDADDYRYFTDPDLPIIKVDSAWLERIKAQIPELPLQKKNRLMRDYQVTEYEADILVQDRAIARYFEEAVRFCEEPKLVTNWLLRDVLGYMKEHKIAIEQFPVTAELLAGLIDKISDGTINTKAAQEVFTAMTSTGKDASTLIKEKGLEQMSNSAQLLEICEKIVNDNPEVVAQYKGGKDRMIGFFVGQAMKATQGRGNPKMINDIFKELLS